MRLDVTDRIMLQGSAILPQEGPYARLTVAKAITEAVAFTPEERERWGITEAGGSWHWLTEVPDPALPAPAIGDPDTRPLVAVDLEADFNIGELGREIIASALERLDREDKLIPPMLGLYAKFVVEPRRAGAEERHAAELAAQSEAATTGRTLPGDDAADDGLLAFKGHDDLAPEFPGPDAPKPRSEYEGAAGV